MTAVRMVDPSLIRNDSAPPHRSNLLFGFLSRCARETRILIPLAPRTTPKRHFCPGDPPPHAVPRTVKHLPANDFQWKGKWTSEGSPPRKREFVRTPARSHERASERGPRAPVLRPLVVRPAGQARAARRWSRHRRGLGEGSRGHAWKRREVLLASVPLKAVSCSPLSRRTGNGQTMSLQVHRP